MMFVLLFKLKAMLPWALSLMDSADWNPFYLRNVYLLILPPTMEVVEWDLVSDLAMALKLTPRNDVRRDQF